MCRAAFLVVLAAGSATPAADPPKADLPRVMDFTGRVEADTVAVRPRVTGYLSRVAVKEGAVVKAGDLLAEIDPRPYQAAVKLADARLRVVLLKATLAAAMRDRLVKASQSGAVTRDEVDRAAAEAEIAAAEVEVAKAERESAALTLSLTELRTPFDGRVGRITAVAGQLLTADDASPVVTVVATGRLTVAFELDEKSLLQMRRAGQAGSVKWDMTFGLRDEPGFPHTGQLVGLEPAINPATGTVRGRAAVADPTGVLLPGLFARVRLTRPAGPNGPNE